MEEKKVTIGDETFSLPSPFVVFATQNPLEHEGTYPLPEAQLDRFLMRIVLSYPSKEDEKKIFAQETLALMDTQISKEGLSSEDASKEKYEKISSNDLLEMIDYINKTVRVDEKIYEYVGDIVSATRKLTNPSKDSQEPALAYGASTRAGLAMIRAGRVRAVIE